MSRLLDISDEELEKDIADTENETKAYGYLAKGFIILANIPGVDLFKARQYHHEYIKYSEFETKCDSFLHTLYDLRQQRLPQSRP